MSLFSFKWRTKSVKEASQLTCGDVVCLEVFFSAGLPLYVFSMQCSGDRGSCWLSFKSLPPAEPSVNQTALQHLVRRGGKRRSCCKSSALLVECRAGKTRTVITYRLWMFQLQDVGGGAMMRPNPLGAANGFYPWRWRFPHQSRVKRGAGPFQQEGAPLWGRGSSLLCQQCSAWHHQVCAHWG